MGVASEVPGHGETDAHHNDVVGQQSDGAQRVRSFACHPGAVDGQPACAEPAASSAPPPASRVQRTTTSDEMAPTDATPGGSVTPFRSPGRSTLVGHDQSVTNSTTPACRSAVSRAVKAAVSFELQCLRDHQAGPPREDP